MTEIPPSSTVVSSSSEIDTTEPERLSSNQPSVRQSVSRSVSYQFIAQIIGLASSLAALPILSRYLGVAGFGVYVTVMSFVSLMTTFTDLGVGATAVREVSAGRLKDGPASTTAAVLRSANAIVVLILGIGLAIVMGQPRDVVVGLVLSSVSIVASCVTAGGGTVIFQVKGRFGWTAVTAAVQAPIWIGSVVLIVFAHVSVLAVFVALGASTVVGAVISLTAARRLLDNPPRFDWSIARALLRQGAPLGVASMLAAAYYKVDTILLSSIAGILVVGLYGAAYRFIDQIRLVASFVGVAYHPIFSRESRNEATFRAELGRLVYIASLVGATGAIGLFSLAQTVVSIMFGARFAAAPGLLRILALAVLPMFLNNSIPYSMIARRKQTIYVPINLAALVFNVGGNLLLIPHFGAIASAILTGLTELLVLALSLTAMRRAFGFLPPLRPLLGVCLGLLVGCSVYLTVADLSYPLAASGSLVAYALTLIVLRVFAPRAAWDLGVVSLQHLSRWWVGKVPAAVAADSDNGTNPA